MLGRIVPVGAERDNGYRFPIKNLLLDPVNIAVVATMGLAISYYGTYYSQNQELCPIGRSFQRVLISSGSSLAAIASCGLLCYATYLYSKQQHRALQLQVNDLSNRVEDLSRAIERLVEQPALPAERPAEWPEFPADDSRERSAEQPAEQPTDERPAVAAASDSDDAGWHSCDHCKAPSIEGDVLKDTADSGL